MGCFDFFKLTFPLGELPVALAYMSAMRRWVKVVLPEPAMPRMRMTVGLALLAF